LSRFNIKAILVDNYNQITEILHEIEDRYKSRSILVSGAAHEYGSWSEKDSLSFIHALSKSLIQSQFKIVSGFGLGVGSAVISGALEQIYMNPSNNKIDQLILRPFPQRVFGTQDLKFVWKRYREDMCSYAGIVIFIFGNKLLANGHVDLSTGMREEFEIAKSKGLFLLPIGTTGYMAKELWEEVMTNFDSLYPDLPLVKAQFALLGDETKLPAEILETTLSILKKITR
jgi:hypothetical protein